MKNLTDREIVLLYSQWSEECYAASFWTLDADGLKRFVVWLKREQPFKDYELELVRQYRALPEQALDG